MTNLIIKTNEHQNVKLKIDDIYYVDKPKRRPCYHLKKKTYLGLTIRDKSFRDVMTGLTEEPPFVLLSNSLLVNLNHIKAIDSYFITFDNGEDIVIPKSKYKWILNIWKEWSK